jgi:hypothetical protein
MADPALLFIVKSCIRDLRKSGPLWYGRCPVCMREAAFALDPEGGSWYCFGSCKDGGNDTPAFLDFCQEAAVA